MLLYVPFSVMTLFGVWAGRKDIRHAPFIVKGSVSRNATQPQVKEVKEASLAAAAAAVVVVVALVVAAVQHLLVAGVQF